MIVVLDSNSIRDNAAMSGPLFAALRAFAEQFGSKVVVPEVVLEAVSTYLSREVDVIQRSITAFQRKSAFAGTVAWKDHQELGLSDVRDALRKRFQEAGFDIEPIPEIDNLVAVRRMHEGLKPFGRGNAEEGYRDYLIWRTVVELAQSDDVVLVTGNGRDFADRDGRLHPDLVADSQWRCVVLRLSLQDAVQQDIRKVLQRDEAVLPWFETWADGREFRAFASEHLPRSRSLVYIDPEYWDFPEELDSLQPQSLIRVQAPRVDSVTRFDDDLVIARVIAKAEIEFGQDLEPHIAEYLETRLEDFGHNAAAYVDAKYRYGSAEITLEGTAVFEISAVTSDQEPPEPTDIELVDFFREGRV